MKKALCVALTIIMIFSLTACSSEITQEEYESACIAASSAESEAAALSTELKSLLNDFLSLRSEYEDYKDSMSIYEGLSEAEATARKIEAESKAAAESIAMEESKQAEEQAAQASREAEEESKATEEALGYETGITYEQLARTPDEYKGKKIKFTGKVIQVIEGNDTVQIRLAVKKNYDTILFCEYDKSIVSSRILDDDVITIYGTSAGLLSYKSTLGGTITIPAAIIDRIDQ